MIRSSVKLMMNPLYRRHSSKLTNFDNVGLLPSGDLIFTVLFDPGSDR
jgi:hypothetical protein